MNFYIFFKKLVKKAFSVNPTRIARLMGVILFAALGLSFSYTQIKAAPITPAKMVVGREPVIIAPPESPTPEGGGSPATTPLATSTTPKTSTSEPKAVNTPTGKKGGTYTPPPYATIISGPLWVTDITKTDEEDCTYTAQLSLYASSSAGPLTVYVDYTATPEIGAAQTVRKTHVINDRQTITSNNIWSFGKDEFEYDINFSVAISSTPGTGVAKNGAQSEILTCF